MSGNRAKQTAETGPPDPAGRPVQSGLMAVENLHRLLVESVRDYAIFALDAAGYVRTWNAGAERIKGYQAEEIIGRHFSTFYPEEDKGKPEWELRVAARDGRVEDEGWRVRKDGSRFWALVVITALRDTEGEIIGYAKVTRDLTERRAAEVRAIEDARHIAQVEAANKAKSEFLTALSHELRTPLNAIGGYVDLLLLGIRGTITAQQAADLQKVKRSQQHLLGIINDLLNFGRLEAHSVEFDIRTFPLEPALENVRDMIEPQALSQHVELVLESCPPGLSARGDAAKVEQILINLLSNAVKFTPSGGRITLGCEQGVSVVSVSVRDTGIGIPEEQLDTIFEPFVQLGRTLTTTQEGAGLGLAISRDLARGMNGELTVQSTPGVGSTFTLTLPG